MTESRLLLVVAGVLAGTAVLFVVLGTVFNLVLMAVAIPFGLAAYLLWLHATGRLADRMRRRQVTRERRARTRQTGWPSGGDTGSNDRGAGWRDRDGASPSMDRQQALSILDLAPGADQRAIRRAYRERVKAVHPDAEGGDEDAFRRVTAAYERLRYR